METLEPPLDPPVHKYYSNMNTVLLLKFSMKILMLLELCQILEVNIQHSIHTHYSHIYTVAYTHDNLCRIIRDYFQSFSKGCRIIRRAKFLEEVRY